jgi:hypothetical protein
MLFSSSAHVMVASYTSISAPVKGKTPAFLKLAMLSKDRHTGFPPNGKQSVPRKGRNVGSSLIVSVRLITSKHACVRHAELG